MLQAENQKATSNLAEAQRRSNQRIAGLEQQIQDADQKLREAVNEKEAVSADRELLKNLNDDVERRLKKAENEIEDLEKRKKEESHLQKSSIRCAEDSLNSVRESSRKYQAQLAQTKGLLRVVQEARNRLQEDNMALRTELDEVLRRSLKAVANEKTASADTTNGKYGKENSNLSSQDITIPKTLAHQPTASPKRPPFIGGTGIPAPQQRQRPRSARKKEKGDSTSIDNQDDEASKELEKLRKEVAALKSAS